MPKERKFRKSLLLVIASFILYLPASVSLAMTQLNVEILLLKSGWVEGGDLKTKLQGVSLKNISDQVLFTPIIRVVVEEISDPEVVVANADGTTLGGKPYFVYSPPGQIGPGLLTDQRDWIFQYPGKKVKFGHPLDYTVSIWVCTDVDGDGYFVESDCGTLADCDDENPLVNPGYEEVCDNLDNDCDSSVDEGVKLSFYRDQDSDGYGDINDMTLACTEPCGYVSNSNDCDDQSKVWFLKDGGSQGWCAFDGYTECTFPYTQQCNPAVTDVTAILSGLDVDVYKEAVDVNKDKFAWLGTDNARPGGPPPDPKHLQSIQYLENNSTRYIVVTMSDEHDSDRALIGLVQTHWFGSEKDCGTGYCDRMIAKRLLSSDETVDPYDHAGGSQIIGNYLFVALEDFDGPANAPKTGVWKIDPTANPKISFEYAVNLEINDKHHTAAAVTRLSDGTYLLAACVVKGCQVVQFYKSSGTSLEEDPGFELVDSWFADELISSVNDDWADCPVQNANMVVDKVSGYIYLVLFGVEKTGGATCGWANGDDHIYGYRIGMTLPGREFKLTFTNKEDIGTGDKCGTGWWTETNFDAGSGLWISPDWKNDVAVLATELYDSCSNGLSRWGVTANWDD